VFLVIAFRKNQASPGKVFTLAGAEACTAVIEATKGNYAVAQALLRHKSMQTTLNVYKKQITPAACKEGMKVYESAASNFSK